MNARSWFVTAFVVLSAPLASACSDIDDSKDPRRNVGPGGAGAGEGAANKEPEAPPLCTDFGKEYAGFGGTKLVEGRVYAAAGADRARMKPYAALRDEYERTIGVMPPSFEGAGQSFGGAPDRFYVEPRASAIAVWAAFRSGFDGCLTFVEGKPEYAAAPTPENAAATCATLARKFWSRAAGAEEVATCTKVALEDASAEPTPQRRWAYTCAALLSSAGFLTY